jgi:ribosomal-protein-alanine N-acetyltransferase
MNTTLKGRVFTIQEFKETLKNDFIQFEHHHVGFWCLTSKTDNKIVGISGLLKCNYLNNDSYEFGFILNEYYWGKGLATEIGKFWLEYAKKEMDLSELIATVSPDNKASRHVLDKLNMEHIGYSSSKERGLRLVLRKAL